MILKDNEHYKPNDYNQEELTDPQKIITRDIDKTELARWKSETLKY